MSDRRHPAPPEALRRRGVTGAKDNVGEDQAVAVSGSLLHQFFGEELAARYTPGKPPAKRGRTHG
ncbi:MAG: hypothetical protein ACLFRB_06725 [Thiohalorhabdus sp.]|uniref:hypothetical protein n=1 Tax=Thiohalorhabdus sp. TaxID=3094134 RepID=UPI00397F488B